MPEQMVRINGNLYREYPVTNLSTQLSVGEGLYFRVLGRGFRFGLVVGISQNPYISVNVAFLHGGTFAFNNDGGSFYSEAPPLQSVLRAVDSQETPQDLIQNPTNSREEEEMNPGATPPTHITFLSPPKRVLDRLADKKLLKKFNEDPTYEPLLDPNLLQGHPDIPKNYYDAEVDGVLKVVNETTGRLIKKENAILLTDGTFRNKVDSDSLLKEAIEHKLSGKPGGSLVKKRGRYYVLSPLDNETLCLSEGNLATLLKKATQEYFSFTGTGVGDVDTIFNKTSLDTVYAAVNAVTMKLPSWFTFERNPRGGLVYPATSRILPNVHILTSPERTFPKEEVPLENRMLLELNTGRIWCIEEGLPQKGYLGEIRFLRELGIHHEGPFELCFHKKSGFNAKMTLPTCNEKGSLLNYFAKAPGLKIPFIKKEKEKDPIFLGLELEVESRDPSKNGRKEVVRSIAGSPLCEHVIMKSDRSIEPYGLEIVTVPATLTIHKERLAALFSPETQLNKKFRSSPATGIHIHVSKKAFTRLSLGKFISFINKPENDAFINAMAGRPPTGYCTKGDFPAIGKIQATKREKGIDISARIGAYTSLTGPSSVTHHRNSVNLSNEATVELRIFKSTNSKANLFRKLEFTEALVKFCKVASLQQMTTYDFVNYLIQPSQQKEYPYLLNWLGEKGHVSRTRVRIKGKHKYTYRYGQPKVKTPENSVFHKTRKEKKGTNQCV